jgi:hypothetical protein
MKVYRQGTEVLVAAADADLIGRTFREGGLKLEVTTFYDGDPVSEEQFLAHLRLATIGNFVGEETVGAAIRGGFVSDTGILRVEGVPHAQMFVMVG